MDSVVARAGSPVTREQIDNLLANALGDTTADERVLILIPDHTRTMPLALLFPLMVQALENARSVSVMVALGTHPPLSQQRILDLLGIAQIERDTVYQRVSLSNHAWDDPQALATIGRLSERRIRALAGKFWHPSLSGEVPIRINRAALAADRIVILGPVFPHEVAGFSGGAKYLFPGISGREFIDTSHWLGALAGILETIGIVSTPVRMMIEEAADLVPTPVTLVGTVVGQDGNLKGIFVGNRREAWSGAVELSSATHIRWLDRPLERVLSCAPPMYDELWTAGKAVYKLEPALADGAELIVYAPHLDTVSQAHGRYLYEIGYHVLPYFLDQWDRFSGIPLSVLAHSTHVKGAGTFRDGKEIPRVNVKLASKISARECAQLNLGYVDPATLDPDDPPEGFRVVANAGEMLYRTRSPGEME